MNLEDMDGYNKIPKKCPICGQGFHWDRGYITHEAFHRTGVIGVDGHLTQDMKYRAQVGRGLKPRWWDDWNVEIMPYQKSRGNGKLTIRIPNSRNGQKVFSVIFPKYKNDEMQDLGNLIMCLFDTLQRHRRKIKS